jgi:hypothetical protein
MYTLVKNEIINQINSVRIVNGDSAISIPFNPANTDYQNFKKEIFADEAQLQDADGNLMTNAKDYVRTLP